MILGWIRRANGNLVPATLVFVVMAFLAAATYSAFTDSSAEITTAGIERVRVIRAIQDNQLALIEELVEMRETQMEILRAVRELQARHP